MEGEEKGEEQCGMAMEYSFSRSYSESFRSYSASTTAFSFRSELSLWHPVSEYEEIPSFRWLSASFLAKPAPSPSPSEGGATDKTRPADYHATVSVFGVRRSNQVASMEVANKQELPELGLFQTLVADRLQSLVSNNGEGEQDKRGQQRCPLISLCFLRKLLEAFVCIEGEFKELLLGLLDRDPALVHRPPVGRLVADLLDRAVSLLDVCSAVGQALDSLQFCQRYAEIAASALRPAPEAAARPLREAQFHRARRALSNLIAFLDVPDEGRQDSATKEWAWLFGRSGSGDGGNGDSSASRRGRQYLSLSVSQNWLAAKQVEAMWANFSPPRGADANDLTMAVYAMNAVMVLLVWTLVLAFPCQGQVGQGPSAVATVAAAPWAAPMVALQERIVEERRDTKGSLGSRASSPGLLAELQSLARCGRAMVEVGGGTPRFPLEDQQQEDVSDVGRELVATCRAMEEQLGPLQRQVREVFHRLQLSRAEVLGCLSREGQENPSLVL